MQVTETTKIADLAAFADYFEQSSIDELKKAADGRFGSPWGITIGQLFACMDGDFSHIGIDMSKAYEITALQYYWMESFKDMVEGLIKSMERMAVPSSPDAKRASAGCLPMTFKESVLVFCREYFGLRSFKDVEALSIDDLLLAKKDTYNKGMFEKGMADIQTQKSKRK